jgi:urease accessory protein
MSTAPAAATTTELPRAHTAPSALLRLMWLASPALPVGGFSYSEGLEAAVEAGLVCNEAQAGDWLLAQLQVSLARADLPAAAEAFDAWYRDDRGRARDLNDWVLQTRESAELRLQAEQMGRSLTEWLRQSADGADPRIAVLAAFEPAPTWPVAFGLASALTGASRHDAALAFGFGWAENMAQAAIKAVPLGQAGAQRVLSRLVDALPSVVEQALQRGDDQRQAFTPMLAILSAQHEEQYSRLFRS